MYCKVDKQLKMRHNILNGDIVNISENFLDNASVEVVAGEAVAA